MLRKKFLKIEYEKDVIGDCLLIYAPVKSYKLAWLLNQKLDCSFEKANDCILDLKNEKKSEHVCYTFFDLASQVNFKLVKNIGSEEIIIRKTPTPDQILLVTGGDNENAINIMEEQCKKLAEITLAIRFPLAELKFAQQLL